MFRGWMRASNGIVLVSGPTGSGKSTTLSAALEEVDDGVKKIITVEDPVEYQMPSIHPDPDPRRDRLHLRARAPGYPPAGPPT